MKKRFVVAFLMHISVVAECCAVVLKKKKENFVGNIYCVKRCYENYSTFVHL